MKLLQQLLNPASYDHPVEEIQLLETHISWVILTGKYAYKIKKPVNLGFLDFSTLEKRCFYCNEEIRLNMRLASQIYLQTVAIAGGENGPKINGSGPILEYAVKMRQFSQQDQFDRLLANNQLSRQHIFDLAILIARFHQSAQVAAPDSTFGDPQHIHTPVEENFSQINTLEENESHRKQLAKISHWSETEFQRLEPLFMERKKNGFVRECHGDMHLRNIAKYENNIVIFDCIEFNENLRWIDVISEVAFIEMDLHDRGRADYANILLNAYLQFSGDYAAVQLLRFYLVYRAMVRAKVAYIRAHQEETQSRTILEEFNHYLNLAVRFTQTSQPALVITCGLSGSGKTYITDQLMESLPFVRLRSDVERKRLFGLAANQNSQSRLDAGLYTREASIKTYQRLVDLSRCILDSQWNVLVDAAFLHADQRQRFQSLAAELGIPFAILYFTAPAQVLRDRVERRQQTQKDASEADVQVLESQMSCHEHPSKVEEDYIVEINSGDNVDIPELAQRLLHVLNIQRRITPP